MIIDGTLRTRPYVSPGRVYEGHDPYYFTLFMALLSLKPLLQYEFWYLSATTHCLSTPCDAYTWRCLACIRVITVETPLLQPARKHSPRSVQRIQQTAERYFTKTANIITTTHGLCPSGISTNVQFGLDTRAEVHTRQRIVQRSRQSDS